MNYFRSCTGNIAWNGHASHSIRRWNSRKRTTNARKRSQATTWAPLKALVIQAEGATTKTAEPNAIFLEIAGGDIPKPNAPPA